MVGAGEEEVETGPVLNRSCCLGLVYRSSSGVGEAVLSSVVFGFGATVPWVHQARATPPLFLHLDFLTVNPVSTCDY